ncbi:MAG: glycosyl transferase, partial [Undibacterium sp.]|nr:glycosyl transferase [Undibacterium sp.]
MGYFGTFIRAMSMLNRTHFLICRTDNIGDVVLTLPITTYLKRHFPKIKISFLCRAYAAPIVRSCASVDEVICLEDITDPLYFFQQSTFDTVLFAQPNKTLARAAHQAGIANRIGNVHRNWFHYLHCNRWVLINKSRSPLHEAQINFEFLRALGIKVLPSLEEIGEMFNLVPPPDPCVFLSPDSFNLVLHPKSNGNGREWPSAYFTELVHLLAREKNIHCYVTGSAAEGQSLSDAAPDLLSAPNVTNLCGTLSLKALIGVIAEADGLIASGTGPLHISSALG